MKYYPHTEKDIKKMLEAIDIASLEELFSEIPKDLLLNEKSTCDSDGCSEYELSSVMKNEYFRSPENGYKLLFAGAGCYEHFIPSVVNHIVSRPEFYTAYTPYQPEASQGTLQSIFEYQSLMCELTGMWVSNASHYDGATALGEAVLMMLRQKDGVVVVSSTMHPRYKQVLMTYLGKKLASRIVWTDMNNGATSIKNINNEKVSCGVIGSPNFFGIIEDVSAFSNMIHEKGGNVIMVSNPLSFGILESPASLGADVAVGEAQPLGLPMCCGGETLGYFCAKKSFLRKIPGRIAGMAKDKQGKRGFVLTLQTREQHIRREKATSNICSNQAHNALRTACYLSYVGKEGLVNIAKRNAKNALHLFNRLKEKGVEILFPDNPFFNEFCFNIPEVDKFFEYCSKKNIIPGVKLKDMGLDYPNSVLTCVTETKNVDEIDFFAEVVGDYLNEK